jgi:general secretion pathway protein A
MYANFYNLKKEPFHITPDPEFLFLSPSHGEALGSIIYGVGQRKGFVMVTGEVGVGKTTIIRSYLEQEDTSKLKIIYLFNANVPFLSLLKTIFQQLDLVHLTDDIYELVNQLHLALIEEFRKGFNVVLIIDEAQNMPVETLENLRMLSNLETSTTKLIQIVFSGQPEFVRKLERQELRQLRQRIAVKSTIQPLTRKESLDYINHRLSKVSTGECAIFTDGALRKIVRHAGGIPRVINVLCENSFVTALGYRQKRITAKIASEVIADFKGKKRRRLFRYALPAVTTVIILFGALITYKTVVTPSPATGNGRTEQEESRTATRTDTGTAGVVSATVTPPPSAPPVAAEREVSVPGKADPGRPVVRVVRKGDTLSELITETYGFSSGKLLAFVRENNPSIRNADRIAVGDRIVFPAREERKGP